MSSTQTKFYDYTSARCLHLPGKSESTDIGIASRMNYPGNFLPPCEAEKNIIGDVDSQDVDPDPSGADEVHCGGTENKLVGVYIDLPGDRKIRNSLSLVEAHKAVLSGESGKFRDILEQYGKEGEATVSHFGIPVVYLDEATHDIFAMVNAIYHKPWMSYWIDDPPLDKLYVTDHISSFDDKN